MSDLTHSKLQDNLFVVGIGASVRGLSALEELFDRLSPSENAAYVVIQHLAPNFKSLMRELLERHTSMPIYCVTEGMELQPNNIYLIPPRQNLALEGRVLRLQERQKNKDSQYELNFPIDLFFSSLAQNYGTNSIGVILSGSGSDESRGLKAIESAGGVALVQDPATAEFEEMPRSAIATGVVDEILSPAKLARLIFQYLTESADPTQVEDKPRQIDLVSLGRITKLLFEEKGVDFSQYKPHTISRRIRRRCLIKNITRIEDYTNFLVGSAAERKILCSDLLINVTQFFRDRLAWQRLEQGVLPQIIEQSQMNGELRFWITACSTGEEAYSLAILVYEALQNSEKNLRAKILATDIDRIALEIASQGVYPASIVKDVSSDRLQEYFVERNESYEIKRKIRKMLIFLPHDLTKDAGFTRINLVTCRNVPIYMRSSLQKRVLRNLHSALVKQGVLFLGQAENLDTSASEFQPLDKKWKLFQKQRDLKLPIPFKIVPDVLKNMPSVPPPAPQSRPSEPILEQCLHRLSRLADCIILIVSQDNHLLHVSGDSHRIFKAPDGRITTRIGEMVVQPLQLPLNTALHRAKQTKKIVKFSDIKLEDRGEIFNLTLEVLPPQNDPCNGDFSIVRIKQEKTVEITPIPAEQSFEDSKTIRHVMELERELQQTQNSLQVLVEELESTNEEQHASNEELVASNEELQSTNEELHSVNEELHTLNAEYQSKIQELTQLNDDIDNLLKSTEIGVIFLDAKLRIRKYTPAATQAIALRPSDISRPLEELQLKFECPHLSELLREVLATQQSMEIEVKLKGAEHYLLMQIKLYQTQSSSSKGLVVSFIKIDEIKQVQLNLEREIAARQSSESELRITQQRVENIFSSLEDAVWSFDLPAGTLGYVNDSFETIYGRSKTEFAANPSLWLEAVYFEDRQIVQEIHRLEQQRQIDLEYRILHRDGSLRWIRDRSKIVFGDRGTPIRQDFIISDLTVQKAAEQALKEREQSFQAIFNSMFQFIGVLSPEGILLEANQTALAFAGVIPDEVLNRPFWEAKWWTISEETQAQLKNAIALAAQGEFVRYEVDVLGAEDKIITIDFSLKPVIDEAGNVVQSIAEGRDVSELKQMREDLWQANLALEQRVEARTKSLAQYSDRLQQLHSLATLNHRTQEDLFADYLQAGCEMLGLSTGIVSRVKNHIYQIVAVKSPLNLQIGDEIPCVDTYCAEVIETKTTVSFAEVGQIESMQNHPVYQNLKLESYIGTPIFVSGNLFGTLNFSDTIPKKAKFTRGEIKIVELMARDIGQEIATLKGKKALEQSEILFRNTFEQVAVGVVHVSPEGKFVRVNQRFCQILDYPNGFPADLTFQEITHPDDLELDLHYFQQMLAKEIASYSIEKRYIRHDESVVWVNITVSMIEDYLGQPDYFVAVIEDISDRKATEFALEQSRTKLKQANQAKDNFIAHMSHELRTPLNSIIGFSHILKQDSDLTPEQLKSIEIVHQSGQHLLTLINDVLDISKQNANKLELKYYDLNLIQFIEDISNIFKIRAQEKNIIFQTQISTHLPVIVNTDETRLRQVLFNLLSNAVKFTSQGTVTLSVSNLDTSAEFHQIRFEVKDTGRGIPEDRYDAVFAPFEQIERDQHDSQGTGLGLSICQNILQLMDSQLCLASKVGQGSCFWFDLSLQKVGKSSFSESESIDLPTFKLKNPCKALVVDDNQDNRILLIQYLESLEFTVTEAHNGQEGIALAEKFQPDVILTDLLMPIMDGKEMIEVIRKHPQLRDTVILLISANLQSIMDSSDIKCNGFLAKPIILEQLAELLEQHLQLDLDRQLPSPLASATIPISPSQLELIDLLKLVSFGNMEALLKQASFLADRNAEYLPFIEKIRQLAVNCQQDELEQLLQNTLSLVKSQTRSDN